MFSVGLSSQTVSSVRAKTVHPSSNKHEAWHAFGASERLMNDARARSFSWELRWQSSNTHSEQRLLVRKPIVIILFSTGYGGFRLKRHY